MENTAGLQTENVVAQVFSFSKRSRNKFWYSGQRRIADEEGGVFHQSWLFCAILSDFCSRKNVRQAWVRSDVPIWSNKKVINVCFAINNVILFSTSLA